MEYARKQRWANYTDIKCREYLRNDFSHECAYCKLHEQETGLIGLNFFEIDHFKPQSHKFADMNKYHNLYYSCKKCNSEKGDIWSTDLLDPCVDDIFCGNNPAIVGGQKETNHRYLAQNDRGTYYINTFKLNSRRQIRIRKGKEDYQSNIHEINELIDEILLKFREKAEQNDLSELISQLDRLRGLKGQELDKLIKDELFENAEKYLNLRGIKNSIVFEEYNMDIKIKINEATYYCELIVDNSSDSREEYRKNLNIEKTHCWFEKLNVNFGVLYYYPNINRMFFYPISGVLTLADFPRDKQSTQIRISEEHLIA